MAAIVRPQDALPVPVDHLQIIRMWPAGVLRLLTDGTRFVLKKLNNTVLSYLLPQILCLTILSTFLQVNCQCIMNAESAANANAMHENSDGSTDVGLWYAILASLDNINLD